jgi:hypothetical protein
MKLDHLSESAFKHSAVSSGRSGILTAEMLRSIGPISLHNAIADQLRSRPQGDVLKGAKRRAEKRKPKAGAC